MTTGLQRAELPESPGLQVPGLGEPQPGDAVLPGGSDGAHVLPFPHVPTTPRSVTWRRRLRELVRRPRARAVARTSRARTSGVAPPATRRGRARDAHDHAMLHGVIPPGF